jgi:hypothetical protein
MPVIACGTCCGEVIEKRFLANHHRFGAHCVADKLVSQVYPRPDEAKSVTLTPSLDIERRKKRDLMESNVHLNQRLRGPALLVLSGAKLFQAACSYRARLV